MDVLPREHTSSTLDTDAPTLPQVPLQPSPVPQMYPTETRPLYPPVAEQFAGPMSPPPITAPIWGTQPPAGGYQPGAPDSGTPPTGTQSLPPRRRWIYAVSAVLFLALVLGSFAAGHALVGNSASPTSSNTSPTVVVPPSATDLQQTLINVAKAVEPSVVEVTSQNGTSEAIGSGVIYTKDGYIVTNDHVVSGFTTFTVTLSNKTSYQAQVVGQDAQDDLAVLKISASNLTPITFADSSQLQVGEFAMAIGSPLGLQETTTFGIVSALNRAASEAPSGPASELVGLVQTSAAINPGNSGGALVNLQGQLIGMPTLGATNTETNTPANEIGFAIPSNRIKYVADQLIQNGHLTSSNQGFLGIQGQAIASGSKTGVQVMGFASDASGKSPAQQAGIQQGDIITAVNGQAITGNDDLAGAVLTLKPGTQVSLTVLRGSAQQTINVTLGERPVSNQG